MQQLYGLIADNEDWLMDRILYYAIDLSGAEALVALISEKNPPLAEALFATIENYRFNTLQQLMREIV